MTKADQKAEERAEKKRVCDRIVAQLNQVTPAIARAMFGGYGIYAEGVMFALIAYNTIYFKVDDGNRPDYEALGLSPFTYDGKGKPIQMSYYQAPPDLFEDVPRLAEWVEKAQTAARRAKRKKSR